MNKEMKAALEFLNMPGIRFALKHTRGRCPPTGRIPWNFDFDEPRRGAEAAGKDCVRR